MWTLTTPKEIRFLSNFDGITLLRNLGLRPRRRGAQEGRPQREAGAEVCRRRHQRRRRRNGRRRRTRVGQIAVVEKTNELAGCRPAVVVDGRLALVEEVQRSCQVPHLRVKIGRGN